ncbi:glycine reductase [Orrella sp. NBD-18]|uniref:Glycine reductase n=2 Tax=Sheuella amnicola TaxID=2707330 RepID=A0A6B2R2K8_9BURK|nr:glycine reductase [Sheuella amnicola]
MTVETDMNFASDDDVPTRYMQRTRDWYLALGYDNPYRWAHYADVPFQPMIKPIEKATVALITTASPYDPEKGDQGIGAPYNAAAKFYQIYTGASCEDHDVRITHVAIDRKHTTMEDSGTWFPLPALRQAQADGRIGKLANRFYGLPTNRSQRHTLEVDCPELIRLCREDGVDAVVFVANCPVCHQTCSLAARYLESAGISTIVMGCAKDIVEHVGVPRFLFSDFPLGNAAGKPNDPKSQYFTLDLALKTLASAPGSRTTVQSSLKWSDSYAWKRDYSNVQCVSPEELARLREKNDQEKEIAKKLREAL